MTFLHRMTQAWDHPDTAHSDDKGRESGNLTHLLKAIFSLSAEWIIKMIDSKLWREALQNTTGPISNPKGIVICMTNINQDCQWDFKSESQTFHILRLRLYVLMSLQKLFWWGTARDWPSCLCLLPVPASGVWRKYGTQPGVCLTRCMGGQPLSWGYADLCRLKK